jgi:hypothetical protein
MNGSLSARVATRRHLTPDGQQLIQEFAKAALERSASPGQRGRAAP